MALEFKLTDFGEGIAEGEIVKWMVQVGDSVVEHQVVVEVKTDKAIVELPSPAAGTITELRAAEGEVVPVGNVLFVLDGGSAAPAAAAPAAAPAPAATGAGGESIECKLPDFGEGDAEGEIVKWLVQVGDGVTEHQTVVEVMTDRAIVEVPSPAAGTITELRAAEGEAVRVGSVLLVLRAHST